MKIIWNTIEPNSTGNGMLFGSQLSSTRASHFIVPAMMPQTERDVTDAQRTLLRWITRLNHRGGSGRLVTFCKNQYWVMNIRNIFMNVSNMIGKKHLTIYPRFKPLVTRDRFRNINNFKKVYLLPTRPIYGIGWSREWGELVEILSESIWLMLSHWRKKSFLNYVMDM